MKTLLTLLLFLPLTYAGAATTGGTQNLDNGITVAWDFTEGPAKGASNDLKLVFTDSAKKPVDGDLEFKFDMKAMKMNVPKGDVDHTGPGTYVIKNIPFSMTGNDWFVDLTFTPGGKKAGNAEIKFQVNN